MDLTTRKLKVRISGPGVKDADGQLKELLEKLPGNFDACHCRNYTFDVGHEGTDERDNMCTAVITIKE